MKISKIPIYIHDLIFGKRKLRIKFDYVNKDNGRDNNNVTSFLQKDFNIPFTANAKITKIYCFKKL